MIQIQINIVLYYSKLVT